MIRTLRRWKNRNWREWWKSGFESGQEHAEARIMRGERGPGNAGAKLALFVGGDYFRAIARWWKVRPTLESLYEETLAYRRERDAELMAALNDWMPPDQPLGPDDI